jgi:DNA-binding MarR family transcriptional regulator
MQALDRDLRAAALRALHAARGPMPESAVIQHLRNLFAHVAFTDADLLRHLRALENAGLVLVVADELAGSFWDLTLKGKTRVAQLDPL